MKKALFVGILATVAVITAPTAADAASGALLKGPPPPVGATAASGAQPHPSALASSAPSFFYADAYQYAVADGAYGYFTVAKPVVGAPVGVNDAHSVAEIAVESSDQRQAVEVGWTVDRAFNGDDDPHLFVYHWVDRVGNNQGHNECPNRCGFVPYNDGSGVATGMKLEVSATPREFKIQHDNHNWWIGYDHHWIGYYPDALWSTAVGIDPTAPVSMSTQLIPTDPPTRIDRFTKAGLVQWFGEVASSTRPCAEMGSGQFASSPTAARIENMGFFAGPASTNVTVHATVPDYYTAEGTGLVDGRYTGMRYGGPGPACTTVTVTVPDIVGQSISIAERDIAAAGLVTGTIGTVVDYRCEQLGEVISQTPAFGTPVPKGSAVSFKYGVAPRPPRHCPDQP